MVSGVRPFGPWYPTAQRVNLLWHDHADESVFRYLCAWDFFEALFQECGECSNVDGIGSGCEARQNADGFLGLFVGDEGMCHGDAVVRGSGRY
jgi:hypothetical protein